MTINTLRAHLLSGFSPVVFLGNGASIEAGSPFASTLVTRLLSRYYNSTSQEECERKFESEFGYPVSYETAIQEFISDDIKVDLLKRINRDLSLTDGYKSFAQLMISGRVHPVVFTTNHDDLIKKGLLDQGVNEGLINVVTPENHEDLPNLTQENNFYIVKMHGDLGNIEFVKSSMSETSSMPVTFGDYLRNNTPSAGLVVMGYAFRDLAISSCLIEIGSSLDGLVFVADVLPLKTNSALASIRAFLGSGGQGYVQGTFESITRDLAKPLSELTARRKDEKVLGKLWKTLAEVHQSGGRITDRDILKQISILSSAKSDTFEIRALIGIVQYDLGKQARSFRLPLAQRALETTYAMFALSTSELDSDLLNDIQFELFFNKFRLYLAGDPIPGGRKEFLTSLIGSLESIDIPPGSHSVRLNLLLAEATKELMLISGKINERIGLLEKVRNITENIIQSEFSQEVDKGTAYRHLAVTFEIEGDDTLDQSERKKHYREWERYSRKACRLLEKSSYQSILGYALINLGSALVRQAHDEPNVKRANFFLSEADVSFAKAKNIFKEINDKRGIGWTLVHICDHRRASLHSSSERKSILLELESLSVVALEHLYFVDDEVATGLALSHLAFSLFEISLNDVDELIVSRAELAMRTAIEKLEHTSFFQAQAETKFDLARLLHFRWSSDLEKTNDADLYAAISEASDALQLLSRLSSSNDLAKTMFQELQKLIQRNILR